MVHKISEKVIVGMKNEPAWVKWRNRVYDIEKIGLHHTSYEGKTLHHIFSIITNSLFMRLDFNTKNLLWTLDEVAEKV